MKSTSDVRYTRFAPKRREAQPVSGITVASDSRYPVITHWMSASGLWRRLWSVSSATLTIVVSRIDMIEPSTITTATRQTKGSIRVLSRSAVVISAATSMPVGRSHRP